MNAPFLIFSHRLLMIEGGFFRESGIFMLGASSQINNFMNVFGVQQGLPAEQLPAPIAQTIGIIPSQHTGDSVSISPTANMLQQLLNMELQNPNGSAESGELDLSGLAQLKQRGEMLANMLQVKLKNFESNLVSEMKSAGIDSQEKMNLKNNNGDGITLLDEIPNKDLVQNLLNNSGKLKNQFQEIAQFADILNVLQQLETRTESETTGRAGMIPATQYTQQSQLNRTEKRPDAEFIIHIMQSGTSYSFE
jgi:hypothetical protein